MPRVLILSNSPTPYNDALFSEVAQQVGVTLRVIYCAELEPHRLWTLSHEKGYEYTVERGISVGATHFNPTIARSIAAFRPDVAVLTGSYVMPSFHLAVHALGKQGVPWLYWGEELSHASLSRIATLVRTSLRRVLKRARLIMAIGSRAATSYERLGIQADRIADFRYYADVDHFAIAEDAAREVRSCRRREWGVTPDTTVFLYCGQLIARKGVDTLLRAAATAHRRGVRLHVVAIGAGRERESLIALTHELGIATHVTFAGFVQPSALPGQFAAADALVLPSMQEGWGLVVPEALAAGLPVIASDRVNAATDLVVDGQSGFRFPSGDATALADSMVAMSAALATSSHMREQARQAVLNETPLHAAERFVELVNGIMERSEVGNVG